MDWRQLTKYTGHTAAINSVCADDKSFYTASDDRTAKQWDIETGRCIQTFVGHDRAVLDICAGHLNGQDFIFTASADFTAKKWMPAPVPEFVPFMGPFTTRGITYEQGRAEEQQHDKVFMTGSAYPVPEDTAPIGSYEGDGRGDRGHIFSVECVQAVGKHLYTGSLDETVREWDITSCVCLREFEIDTMMYSICIRGEYLYTGCVGDWSKAARMWDLVSGEEVRQFTGHTGDVLDVSVDEAGRYLYTSSGFPDCCIKQWDINTGECLRTIGASDLDGGAQEQLSTRPDGHTHDIRQLLCFGGRVISASDDHTVKEWDVRSGKCARTYTGHTGGVRALCFHAGNVYTGSADKLGLKLWAYPASGYTDLCLSPRSPSIPKQSPSVSPRPPRLVTTGSSQRIMSPPSTPPPASAAKRGVKS